MLYWFNLNLAQEKGFRFYQTPSHAVILCNTLLAAFIEKVVCRKTYEELYQKVRLTLRAKIELARKALQDRQNQSNGDVTSIPGYVIKKKSNRGAKHGPFERQNMYYQAKEMQKKGSTGKHGCHPTILSRWYASETYRTFLSLIGWKEKDMLLHDRIPVEKHIYVETRGE